MGKRREAFEKHESSWGQDLLTREEIFNSGYQAAIADVKAGVPVAWILRDPFGQDGLYFYNKGGRCEELYKLPEDV